MKKAELVGLRYTQLQTNLNIFKFMILTMVKNSSCFGVPLLVKKKVQYCQINAP